MTTGKKMKPFQDRFWSRVTKTDSCWLWTGQKVRSGHGRLWRGRAVAGKVFAHVAAWELLRGPVPSGKFVCHHCDVPACVNPDHLYVGGASENTRDAWARGLLPGRFTADALHELSRMTNQQAMDFFLLTRRQAYVYRCRARKLLKEATK